MLAIIPARGGSKGVPMKNIKPLGGKPLILWTVEAAMASKKIERVILSTDDAEIADVCMETGVDIPFMRPPELAQDDSLAIDNYIHIIKRLASDFGEQHENFVVLQPTTPLRNSMDIDGAIELFLKKDADSVISCVELDHPPDLMFSINDDGAVERFKDVETRKAMNRQSSDTAYIPNGGVFVFKFSLLMEHYSYYSKKTYAYPMPQRRSVDIDTLFDFEYVEFLMTQGNILTMPTIVSQTNKATHV
jgi:CMP-N,N'-diacetyllegionaminic acid synthase